MSMIDSGAATMSTVKSLSARVVHTQQERPVVAHLRYGPNVQGQAKNYTEAPRECWLDSVRITFEAHRASALSKVGLVACIATLILGGCGGGGSGPTSSINSSSSSSSTSSDGRSSSGGGSTTTYPSLTSATDFNSFVSSVTEQYPVALQYFQTYFPAALGQPSGTNTIANVSGGLAFTNQNANPIQGEYKNYALAEYPNFNGYLEFAGPNSGVMSYSGYDTTNQQTENGGAQAFFGALVLVQDADQGTSVPESTNALRVSILIETIVTDSTGVAQYRSMDVYIGDLADYTGAAVEGTVSISGPFADDFQLANPVGSSVTGPVPDGIPGHLFVGNFAQVVLECYVSGCTTGLALQYSVFLQAS